MSGTIPAASFASPNVIFDLYTVDSAGLKSTNFWPAPMTHPLTWLGTYTDNGPSDLNPNANEFSIDVSSFGLSDATCLAAAASYSQTPGIFNATNSVTSPMSNPISKRPEIRLARTGDTTMEVSWIAPEGLYAVEQNSELLPGGWSPPSFDIPTYFNGRNILSVFYDSFAFSQFFRLTSQ